jgi:Na+/proline symporter
MRRGAIMLILLLGYVYFHLAGEAYALVSIGLISFAAVAQFAPAVLGGHVLARRHPHRCAGGLLRGLRCGSTR